MRIWKGTLLPVNIALLAIGIADLLTTLVWLRSGRVTEVNPIMAGAFSLSPALFVVVKLATLATYVSVMEWYRRNRNPVFARAASNFTVLAYVTIYSVSFLVVNHGLIGQ